MGDDTAEHDVGRYIVRVRRLADLSQRDLAARVGVAPSTIGRYETGAASPGPSLFAEILALAGLRLAVVDAQGREVRPVSDDLVRDNQGRRFPAHLDVTPPDEVPYERWAFPRYDRPDAQGWYHLRARRDRDVERSPRGERPVEHPTQGELRRRRRLMRGPQPRVSSPAVVEEECACLDVCFEAFCVPTCPCQCEPGRGRRPVS